MTPETTETIESIMAWVGTVMLIANLIVATTPTPKDDTILGKFYKIVELLAGTILRSKEKGPQ